MQPLRMLLQNHAWTGASHRLTWRGRCLAHEGEEASFGLPFVQTLRERIAATQLAERKVSDLPPGSDRTHDKIVVWLKAQLFQLRLSTTGR
jgi:hypothetical protein